jgi:hypothetical protein
MHSPSDTTRQDGSRAVRQHQPDRSNQRRHQRLQGGRRHQLTDVVMGAVSPVLPSVFAASPRQRACASRPLLEQSSPLSTLHLR